MKSESGLKINGMIFFCLRLNNSVRSLAKYPESTEFSVSLVLTNWNSLSRSIYLL